ncbi:MAG: hypothetical protein ACTSU5_01300 [Promethearchaeota archaeon]
MMDMDDYVVTRCPTCMEKTRAGRTTCRHCGGRVKSTVDVTGFEQMFSQLVAGIPGTLLLEGQLARAISDDSLRAFVEAFTETGVAGEIANRFVGAWVTRAHQLTALDPSLAQTMGELVEFLESEARSLREVTVIPTPQNPLRKLVARYHSLEHLQGEADLERLELLDAIEAAANCVIQAHAKLEKAHRDYKSGQHGHMRAKASGARPGRVRVNLEYHHAMRALSSLPAFLYSRDVANLGGATI